MVTKEEIDRMDEDDLRLLLASGLKGQDYKNVMNAYIQKMKKWKR
jgi:hypothetical protein